jgi:hypothetical protein
VRLLTVILLCAFSGVTQLVFLDPKAVVVLLRKSLMPTNSQSNADMSLDRSRGITDGWLNELWLYLARFFPCDLTSFEDLHILPLGNRKLAKLAKDGCVVVSEFGNEKLSADLKNICKQLGLRVIDNLQPAVAGHRALWGRYVHQPNASGVLLAMRNPPLDSLSKAFSKLNKNEKRKIRTFIVRGLLAAPDIFQAGKHVISALPMFETVANSGFKDSNVCLHRRRENGGSTQACTH